MRILSAISLLETKALLRVINYGTNNRFRAICDTSSDYFAIEVTKANSELLNAFQVWYFWNEYQVGIIHFL